MYNSSFYLLDPIGNNAFSYDLRHKKSIFVPNIIDDNIKNISKSKKESFIEINEDDLEIRSYGLKNFIKYNNIYLFDNHNHCYYFYKKFLRDSKLDKLDFIHIDQHKDLREPDFFIDEFKLKFASYLKYFKNSNLPIDDFFGNYEKEEVYDFFYTNFELNVGNFIKPLLKENKIKDLVIVDSKYSMDNFDYNKIEENYVLDLDLDFFSKDMDYIDYEYKIEFTSRIFNKAKAVFIATSPYFIDFDLAKKSLFDIINYRKNKNF